MRISRIYQALIFAPGQTIDLDQRASHYVAKVLRLRVGDELVLFDGKGVECRVEISDIAKMVSVVVRSISKSSVESPLKIHLYQGLCRGEKMDFVIQKSVELGVREITPILTERTEVKLKADKLEKRLEHWRGVVVSACEQSGRSVLPQVNSPIKLSEVRCDTNTLILDPVSESSLKSLQSSESFSLVIGPEGGLSSDEITQLKNSGATPVSLGPRVLRTETAALTTIASLQTLFGDF